jgi:hypothetical protein
VNKFSKECRSCSAAAKPTRAVRLKNSHTLISDQYNHRVIEVNHGKQIVRTFGKLGDLGYNTESVADGGLNSPYDAKRIGDYTDLTPPFGQNDGDNDNSGDANSVHEGTP